MQLRAATPADIPAVVRLRARAFARTAQPTPVAAEAYFQRVLFDHPWRDGALPSLVAVDDTGAVRGFIGVLTRPMRCAGRAVRMAVPTQLMADHDAGGLVGVSLLRAMLAGPQDLTWSDAANDAARSIWERLGGVTVHHLSCFWNLPLYPWREAVRRWGPSKSARLARLVMRPLVAACDTVHRRVRRVSALPSGVTLVALTPELVSEQIIAASPAGTLVPQYEPAALVWLLELLRGRSGTTVSAMAVHSGGAPVGWFVVSAQGSRADLLQLAALPGHLAAVHAAMIADTAGTAAQALVARYDAATAATWSGTRARLERRGPWALLKTRDSALEHEVLSGRAVLSRLEGEAWLAF